MNTKVCVLVCLNEFVACLVNFPLLQNSCTAFNKNFGLIFILNKEHYAVLLTFANNN